MNGQHATIQIRHGLLSDCFVVVFLVNVLEDLFRGERKTGDAVAFYPQSWSVIVLVVGNVNLVITEVVLVLFDVCLPSDLDESILVGACGLLDVL